MLQETLAIQDAAYIRCFNYICTWLLVLVHYIHTVIRGLLTNSNGICHLVVIVPCNRYSQPGIPVETIWSCLMFLRYSLSNFCYDALLFGTINGMTKIVYNLANLFTACDTLHAEVHYQLFGRFHIDIWAILEKVSSKGECSLCSFSVVSDCVSTKEFHIKLHELVGNSWTILKQLGYEKIYEKIKCDFHIMQQLVVSTNAMWLLFFVLLFLTLSSFCIGKWKILGWQWKQQNIWGGNLHYPASLWADSQ